MLTFKQFLFEETKHLEEIPEFTEPTEKDDMTDYNTQNGFKNHKKLPTYLYHGTDEKSAENILTRGAKNYFSLTSHLPSAAFYAAQRASDKKRNRGVVLRIHKDQLKYLFDTGKVERNDSMDYGTDILVKTGRKGIPAKHFRISHTVPASKEE